MVIAPKKTSRSESRRSRRKPRGTGNDRAARAVARSVQHLARIGKEVDRLDEDEGASLEPELPVDYERDDLAEDIAYLAAFPQEATARDLRLTARGWRDLIKGRFKPRKATANRIARVATDYRLAFRK